MGEPDGLISAYVLDGRGGGREVGWAEIDTWQPQAGCLWVHLDRTGTESRRWLTERSGIDPLACEALLADETRPRSTRIGDGLLAILRGVNLNPGADPEDMVSLRMWVEASRVVSLRMRRIMATDDIRKSIAEGSGPTSAPDFLARVAACLIDRMGPVLAEIDDQVDELEDHVLTAESQELRTRLGAYRRQAISLRRYLAPQRDALARLQAESLPWLGDLQRAHLREILDRVTRYVEDLDAIRERGAVLQEELSSRHAEQMNRTMYVLSLVAAVFLPLGLVTGLLGINVGGIPWADNPHGFALVTAILVVIVGALLWFFRRRRLF
jgi:zinc transporter